MLRSSKSFLAIDFGAGSLKMAEFDINEAGSLSLRQYGIKPLGLEGAQESRREAAVQKALQELLAEQSFRAKNINICAPGFHVFSKFVKLPPVDSAKVTQIIQYEAQQNVPFPLEEVVWDYQILGTSPAGELEVLLVAVKSNIVEGLFRVAESRGLRLQLVDASPAALCNAFRFNYGDLDGCTMVLDIGAKTSNLLLFEKGKFYCRGINIGANSITQDFATESKLRFAEAEQIKIAEGFVSLGGAYEEPENPRQAQISKIARQVMTRLHIQVNQTIQFYRGQQGGLAPQRLFLCGGASVMPYTAQFFAEKLNVPVDYFNPLRNIQIDPSINLEDLARVAHSLGEVVGGALRNMAQCPVELNLMPKSSLQKQQLSQKKPYFIASLGSVVLVALALAQFTSIVAADKRRTLDEVDTVVTPLQAKARELNRAVSGIRSATSEMGQLEEYLKTKLYWVELLAELRQIFAQTEEKATAAFGTETGIWIEAMKMNTRSESATVAAEDAAAGPAPTAEESEDANERRRRIMEMYRKRYGISMNMPGMPGGGGEAQEAPRETNEISYVNLTCRGINLTQVLGSADANTKFVQILEEGLRASPRLVASNTLVKGPLTTNDLTFSVGVQLQLQRPIKFVY